MPDGNFHLFIMTSWCNNAAFIITVRTVCGGNQEFTGVVLCYLQDPLSTTIKLYMV